MSRLLFLLAVLFAVSDANADAPELRASIEIDRAQAYVNEQVLVTVRVVAPTTAFKVTKPNLKLADVELQALHKQDYDQTIDGADFTVSEIVYAIFVQQPGELTIASQKFKATLPITVEGESSNPVLTAETNERRLKITPAIATNQTWLPAQSVSLTSVWAAENNAEFRAGEPVKRTISIHIEGQHPAAIPDIAIPETGGVKSYPDLPQLELKKSLTGLGGVQTRSVTLIMDRAGTVTLPALRVDWWDINDRTWKQATLPAEKVDVEPALESSDWVNVRNRYRWAVLLLSVTTLGLALLCAVLWYKRYPVGTRDALQGTQATPDISEKAAWSKLRRSLKQQQPALVRKDLLIWVQARWPTLGITRLDQLERIDSDLASQALRLNSSLYAKEPKQDADYREITQVLLRLRKVNKRIAVQFADGVQQKLYPDH